MINQLLEIYKYKIKLIGNLLNQWEFTKNILEDSEIIQCKDNNEK